MDPAADFLEHYGVKGMKWGVRRSPKQLKSYTDENGRLRKPSADAIQANKYRNAVRVGGRKAGLASLSNAELKSLVNRMNLEVQFRELNAKDRSAGKKFVERLLLGNIERSANLAIATSTQGMIQRRS